MVPVLGYLTGLLTADERAGRLHAPSADFAENAKLKLFLLRVRENATTFYRQDRKVDYLLPYIIIIFT